jgi:hypothetical protein
VNWERLSVCETEGGERGKVGEGDGHGDVIREGRSVVSVIWMPITFLAE